jgi:hypothetical protein
LLLVLLLLLLLLLLLWSWGSCWQRHAAAAGGCHTSKEGFRGGQQ